MFLQVLSLIWTEKHGDERVKTKGAEISKTIENNKKQRQQLASIIIDAIGKRFPKNEMLLEKKQCQTPSGLCSCVQVRWEYWIVPSI